MSRTRKSRPSQKVYFNGKHRYEHWYRDNQVYFITSRCFNRFAAFASEEAKAIFWERVEYYMNLHSFVPWIISLLDNHYHILGYLKYGNDLGPMMRKFHGSVAKLVNDLLPERHVPFWGERGHKDYFDGCIRDELQCRRAYRYVLKQSVRHGVARDYRLYPHTRVYIELERGMRRATELRAFLYGVPYRRYERD